MFDNRESAAYKRRKKTLGRNFFSGRCVVWRRIKGKIFPFRTLFLLDVSLLCFFSWELHENEKKRRKTNRKDSSVFKSQAETDEVFPIRFPDYAPLSFISMWGQSGILSICPFLLFLPVAFGFDCLFLGSVDSTLFREGKCFFPLIKFEPCRFDLKSPLFG